MKKSWMAVAALAIGLAAVAEAGMPLQLGIAGDAAQIFAQEREITGLKLNLPYAANDYASGLDLGLIGGAGEFKGLRLNAVNLSSIQTTGLEFGVLNLAGGDVHGGQIAVFNRGGDVHGMQFGIANYAEHLHGIQIGLINIVADGHTLVLPLVNWGF